jgi:hypothetical protein
VGSVRRECLDHLLILKERHLLRVLITCVHFYNEHRPDQGLPQRCPVPLTSGPGAGSIRCRDILDRILHDYHWEAA